MLGKMSTPSSQRKAYGRWGLENSKWKWLFLFFQKQEAWEEAAEVCVQIGRSNWE